MKKRKLLAATLALALLAATAGWAEEAVVTPSEPVEAATEALEIACSSEGEKEGNALVLTLDANAQAVFSWQDVADAYAVEITRMPEEGEEALLSAQTDAACLSLAAAEWASEAPLILSVTAQADGTAFTGVIVFRVELEKETESTGLATVTPSEPEPAAENVEAEAASAKPSKSTKQSERIESAEAAAEEAEETAAQSSGSSRRSGSSKSSSGGKSASSSGKSRSIHSSSKSKKTKETAYMLELPDGPVSVLNANGEALAIALNSGESAFLVEEEDDLLRLVSEEREGVWTASAGALDVLRRCGYGRVELFLGDRACLFTLTEEPGEDESQEMPDALWTFDGNGLGLLAGGVRFAVDPAGDEDGGIS